LEAISPGLLCRPSADDICQQRRRGKKTLLPYEDRDVLLREQRAERQARRQLHQRHDSADPCAKHEGYQAFETRSVPVDMFEPFEEPIRVVVLLADVRHEPECARYQRPPPTSSMRTL